MKKLSTLNFVKNLILRENSSQLKTWLQKRKSVINQKTLSKWVLWFEVPTVDDACNMAVCDLPAYAR
jgi:arginine repressor